MKTLMMSMMAQSVMMKHWEGPRGLGEALQKMRVRPGDVPDGIHNLRDEIVYRV